MPLNASNLLRTIPQAQDIGHYEMQNGLLRSNALGNRLREDDIQANALKRQEYQRSIEDANRLREVVKGFGTDTSANLQALLKAGRLGEAQAYQKALDESAKARAAAGKDYADTDGKIQSQQITAKDQHIAQLAGVNDPQTAVPWVEAGRRSGAFSPEQADRILKGLEAAQSPEEFPKWKAAAMRWAVAPKDQMKQDFDAAKQAEDVRQFGVTSGETIRANQAREANAAGQLAVSRGNLANSQQRLAFDKSKPAGGRGAGPMSVTLQKELLESDDIVNSAEAVTGILDKALEINDKAYSGYGAKWRATVQSNVTGGSESANATIDLDNMVTEQALGSLKAIFGGLPTEGERKILLDMQASADKTPDQRKTILERAKVAAARRAGYAKAKAKSIRDGSYLTEGAPAPEPAGKTVKRTGKSGGRKVVEYSDGSIEYAD